MSGESPSTSRSSSTTRRTIEATLRTPQGGEYLIWYEIGPVMGRRFRFTSRLSGKEAVTRPVVWIERFRVFEHNGRIRPPGEPQLGYVKDYWFTVEGGARFHLETTDRIHVLNGPAPDLHPRAVR